jgi:hypothetical protein
MRSKIYFFYILICPILGYSQSSFNLIQDYAYPINHFNDILVQNDTIYGLGIAYDTSISPLQAVLLVQLDSNAQLLKKKLYYDSLGRNLTITRFYKNKLRPTKNGGFLFFAAPAEDESAILYKLSPELEVVRTIEFPNVDNLRSNFEYRALELDDGYLLYGTLQGQDYQIFGFVRRVDHDGNKLWEKRFNYNEMLNVVTDLQLQNDSVALVAHNVSNDYDQFEVFYALRTINLQTGATLKYTETLNEVQDRELTHSHLLPDGSIIVCANELEGANAIYHTVRPTFTKYNADLEPVWKRYWGGGGFQSTSGSLKNSYVDLEGNIITIGDTALDTFYQGIDNNYRVGWYFKYSPDGDSIWERHVYPVTSNQLDQVFLATYAGGLLSSGSIIGGGQVRIQGKYYAWLVKITTDGCLDTLFACSPPSSAGEVWPAATQPTALAIAPNPADQSVSLGIDGYMYAPQVLLYDISGRAYPVVATATTGHMVTIGTAHLPSGIYIAVLRHSRGVATGRLVVQH